MCIIDTFRRSWQLRCKLNYFFYKQTVRIFCMKEQNWRENFMSEGRAVTQNIKWKILCNHYLYDVLFPSLQPVFVNVYLIIVQYFPSIIRIILLTHRLVFLQMQQTSLKEIVNMSRIKDPCVEQYIGQTVNPYSDSATVCQHVGPLSGHRMSNYKQFPCKM